MSFAVHACSLLRLLQGCSAELLHLHLGKSQQLHVRILEIFRANVFEFFL
jgi:hypothetical protein